MINSSSWYNFQEEISDYFNSIGADAKTNQTIQGVRTKHDIDVLVKTKFLGEDVVWIIEAKDWQTNIPKEKVLALRTIVDDIGADRGFIISQKGFQKGAYEASENSNVKLKTFDELKKTSSDFIQDEILKSYKKRVNLLTKKYWSHSKQTRKDYNLREELCDMTFYFSGAAILRTVEGAISLAKKNEYPIDVDTHYEKRAGNDIVENFQQLRNWLDLNLNLLDYEILRAEYEMLKNGDFKPDIERLNPEFEETQMFGEIFLSMMKLKKKDLL